MIRNIETYIHCGECCDELEANCDSVEMEKMSIQKYSDYDFGITSDGDIQLWCNRHKIPVVTISDVPEFAREHLGVCHECEHEE